MYVFLFKFCSGQLCCPSFGATGPGVPTPPPCIDIYPGEPIPTNTGDQCVVYHKCRSDNDCLGDAEKCCKSSETSPFECLYSLPCPVGQ